MRKIIILTILLLILSLLNGCVIELNNSEDYKDHEIIDEKIELNDIKDANVTIKTNGAKVNLDHSETNLLESHFSGDTDVIKPFMDLKGNKLNIENKRLVKLKNLNLNKQIWDLKLTDEIPISLNINSNACKNYYNFTELKLKDINIDLNASDTDIYFEDKNSEKVKEFYLMNNAGKVNIHGIGNINAEELKLECNAGSLNLNIKELSNDMDIDITGNASKISIEIPEEVGFNVVNKGQLSNINMNREVTLLNKTYKSKNYDSAKYKLNIYIHGNAISTDIK